MRSDRYHAALFWLAIATAVTALLPIAVGSLVTTLDAGMAFNDWPTSDGQGMLSYPWLRSAGDKFVEHGHRLAGMLIGCMSIVFAVSVWLLESRRWVRWCALGVLLAVIVQGLLGGGRVLADERIYAMFHGAFAAAVFAFMSSMALVLSRSWIEPPRLASSTGPTNAVPTSVRVLTVATPVLILVQYSLGGLVRHLGRALYEHVGMAMVVLIVVAATVIAVSRTRCAWLRRPAYLMGLVALAQVLLGGGAWLTKYGFAPLGYVAVQRTVMQTVVRTSHTVVGMLLLMTSVILLVRVLRIAATLRTVPRPIEMPISPLAAGLKGAS
jgi:cytochrome c oxidase assembly protein subunit 15